MTPNDSLQLPVSRPLFDKPSNLICPDRDGTRMECVFALVTLRWARSYLMNHDGVNQTAEVVDEEGDLISGASHLATVVRIASTTLMIELACDWI